MIQRTRPYIIGAVLLALYLWFMFCAFGWLNEAYADGLKFVLCLHETGKASGAIHDSRGIDAAGITVVTKEMVTGIVPTEKDACTVIETTKGAATVVGNAQEVYCRIYGCYNWPSEGEK